MFDWIIYAMIADEYPNIFTYGVICWVVSGLLTIGKIETALRLRDIRPRAVQHVKVYFKLCLVWIFISIPLSFVSGLDAEQLLPGILWTVFVRVIGFAIWYSYFSVSKRVQATYPDWTD